MSNWSDPIIRAMRDYCIQYPQNADAAAQMREDLGTPCGPEDLAAVRRRMSRDELNPPKPTAKWGRRKQQVEVVEDRIIG